jgi:hypothetical protein
VAVGALLGAIVEALHDDRLAPGVAPLQHHHPLRHQRLDERQQIVAQILEHHTHMSPVRPRVLEVVHELHHPASILRVPIRNLLQDCDLILRRLRVMLRVLLHLQRYKFLVMRVPDQPDGGEVAPTELAVHDVAALAEPIANAHGMVTPAPVLVAALAHVARTPCTRQARSPISHRKPSLLPCLRTQNRSQPH